MSKDKNILESMILNGTVEPAGMDMNSGEMLYTFTEKLAQFSPPLHKRLMNYVHSEIMFLWQNGFLEIDLTDDSPTVRLTEKAFSAAHTDTLNAEQLLNLKQIIGLMSKE
jgi:hypothetical protein